jgi:hypothetical protein
MGGCQEAYSFGSGGRFRCRVEGPGPGHYDIAGTIGRIPKYHKLRGAAKTVHVRPVQVAA